MRNDAYEEALQEGLDAMQRQDMPMAEVSLRAAIAARPESHQARYLMGAALAQSGRLAEAEASFLACLGIAQDYGIARYQLGLLQIVGGRYESGSATLRPLTWLADNAYLKWFARGLIELVAGESEGALLSLERGVALNEEIPVLNNDVRRMMARIRSAAAVSLPNDVARDAEDVSHFLIGGYRQQ